MWNKSFLAALWSQMLGAVRRSTLTPPSSGASITWCADPRRGPTPIYNPICFSPHLYRARNLIEPFFNKIKQCRCVATRYDKLASNHLAFIKLVSIRIWLRAKLHHLVVKLRQEVSQDCFKRLQVGDDPANTLRVLFNLQGSLPL
jgi:hypothetical protein